MKSTEKKKKVKKKPFGYDMVMSATPSFLVLTLGIMGFVFYWQNMQLENMLGGEVGLVVRRVIDGDQFLANTDDGYLVKVRLRAVDAPELDQPFGKQAAAGLTEMLTKPHTDVIAFFYERDHEGRYIADVFTQTSVWAEFTYIQSALIKEGLAWHFGTFDKRVKLKELMANASNAKIGLWQDEDPLPPWRHRKTKEREAELIQNMKRAVVCLGLLLFAGQSSGFSVKLTGTAKIGESKGKGKYWKPGGGVGFGQGHMAMTVKTSSKGNENKVVFTVNGGDNFQEYQGDEAFCGLKSFVIEDKNTRVCPDESQQAPDDDSIKMPVVEWSISAGGIMSSSSMEAKRPEAKLTVWTQAIKRETPRKVRFGDNLLDMKDKKLMFRLAEITFPPAEDEDEEDDSVHNVILKSQDGGYSWFYLGTLPIELGKENTLERQGENGFIVYTKANNTIFSVASKTLGRKWGNATEVSHFQNLPSYLNTRFTSIMAGGRGTPSLAAIGGKKGSEKFFNLARHHNDMLEDAHDYPEGFLKATEKESNAECEKGADEEKCASSGHVSISSFGEDPDNKNLTKIMMCYDKVAGWDSEDQDAIYCMKGHVNETTELVAHEAKMKKREEKKKQEQEARERAQKYAEEQRQRKKQEKREKDRKVRMQRQEWAKIDNEVYIVPAKVDYLEDGDFVVVRDLGKHAMYADFMEETVGLPNKEDLTKEAESEAAEEEK